jgi:hypothetical protein
MADSKIPKSLASDIKHKTITVTGTTDSNGFITTTLDARNIIPLTVTNLKVDNVNKAPYYANFLLHGGNGTVIALKFKSWDDTVYKGTIEAILVYEEIRS